MNIIIHYGLAKTGTTSIQNSLYQKITDSNFHYFDLGKANASEQMHLLFGRPISKRFFYDEKNTSQAEIQELRDQASLALREQMRLCEGKTGILSAESIGSFNFEELSLLHGALAEGGCTNLSAIGYIRPIKSFIESSFQEQSKSLGKVDFSKLPELELKTRFEPFEKVFGKENVRYIKFDPAAFPESSVVQDFCKHIGLTLSPDQEVKINEGISVDAVRLLYAFKNRAGGYKPGANANRRRDRLVRTLIAGLQGNSFRIHSKVLKPYLKKLAKDNAWMEERLGKPLNEDIERHDSYAIQKESDLYDFCPDSLQWLRDELGASYSGDLKTSEQVGIAVGALCEKLAEQYNLQD